MEVPAGYVIGGWTVGRRIASGQFGCVYAAHRGAESTLPHAGEAGSDDRAAIKFTRTLTDAGRAGLDLCMAQDAALRERGAAPWAVRVRTVITVRDEHLPALDGSAAVVMELAEASLEDLIGRTEVNVERLLLDTVRAVVGMHAFVDGRGSIFHGDLKPSNILVLADGSVRIGDLDLVQATEGTHLDPTVAHPGTRDYLPPEAIAGDPHVRVSHDVWALGVIAHRLLSGGAHPFPAQDGSRAAALVEYAAGRRPLEPHANLAAFPTVWTRMVRSCLHPDRAERAAPGALGRLAEEIKRGSPGSRRPPTPLEPRPVSPPPGPLPARTAPVERIRPRPRGRRFGVLVVALVAALAAVAGAGAVALVDRAPRPAAAALPLGVVRPSDAFSANDQCGPEIAVKQLRVRSCIHHTDTTVYAGLLVHATALAPRVEAVVGESSMSGPGAELRSYPQAHQVIALEADETLALTTIPHTGGPTDCWAASGYLVSDPTVVIRSPFKAARETCTAPASWPIATADDPPSPRPTVEIPGGFADTDCAAAWTAGPSGSSLQYRPCLYHRTDGSERWIGGAEVRNISAAAAAPSTWHLELITRRAGQQGLSAKGPQQDVDLDGVPGGATRSVAASDRRWPASGADVCLAARAWAGASNGGSAPVSPFRGESGQTCAT